MFYNTADFDSDLSGWSTSKVTDMSRVFWGALKFSGNIASWDTSQVISMRDILHWAPAFNHDISQWDVSKVTDFYHAFVYNIALSECNKQLIYSAWSASNGGFGFAQGSIDADWSSFAGCPSPPPIAPPPPNGAIIELTGEQPKILFGDLGSPMCELFLDRDSNQLQSTCEVQTPLGVQGRRLDLGGAADAIEADLVALKAEVAQMQQALKELLMVND